MTPMTSPNSMGATDSTLSHISTYEQGVMVAQNHTTPGDSPERRRALANSIYTGGLPEGDYYFFVTSSLTGDFPLFRSGKLTVNIIRMSNLPVGTSGDGFDNSGGHADDAAVTLDTGDFYDPAGNKATTTGSSITNVDLYLSVDDG